MSDSDYLSKEHLKKVDRRYLLLQRQIVGDVAKACAVIASYRHPGTSAAENAATGIQTLLLEYEVMLAEADRHRFADKRRSRPRKAKFALPDKRAPEGLEREGYARQCLQDAFNTLDQAYGNLWIRTNLDLPPEYKATDELDREFLLKLYPILHKMYKELSLIGWDREHWREPEKLG